MVQFDGETFRRKLELFDQIRDARAWIYLMRIAVNDYFDDVLSVHDRDYPQTYHIFKVWSQRTGNSQDDLWKVFEFAVAEAKNKT
jgi:hypothetical protein